MSSFTSSAKERTFPSGEDQEKSLHSILLQLPLAEKTVFLPLTCSLGPKWQLVFTAKTLQKRYQGFQTALGEGDGFYKHLATLVPTADPWVWQISPQRQRPSMCVPSASSRGSQQAFIWGIQGLANSPQLSLPLPLVQLWNNWPVMKSCLPGPWGRSKGGWGEGGQTAKCSKAEEAKVSAGHLALWEACGKGS